MSFAAALGAGTMAVPSREEKANSRGHAPFTSGLKQTLRAEPIEVRFLLLGRPNAAASEWSSKHPMRSFKLSPKMETERSSDSALLELHWEECRTLAAKPLGRC